MWLAIIGLYLSAGCSDTTSPQASGRLDVVVSPDSLHITTTYLGAKVVVVQSSIRNRHSFAVRLATSLIVQSRGVDGSWRVIDAGQPVYIEDWSFPCDLDAGAVGSPATFGLASSILTLTPGHFRLIYRYRRVSAVGGSVTESVDHEAVSNDFFVL